MEDEHIQIDNISVHLGSMLTCPSPNAFYGGFDGHGGPDAVAYINRQAVKFFIEDAQFPHALESDVVIMNSLENAVQKAFLHADFAFSDDCTGNSSSKTIAPATLIFGRLQLVVNVRDCRAAVYDKADAVDMSPDHMPIYVSEQQRVKICSGRCYSCCCYTHRFNGFSYTESSSLESMRKMLSNY